MKRSNRSVSYASGSEAVSKVPDTAASYSKRPQPQTGFVEARGARSGSLGTTAKDRLQRVAQYYHEFLKREGYEVSENSTTAEAGAMTFLSGRKEVEGKTLVMVCTESQEGTHIFLSSDESEDPTQP